MSEYAPGTVAMAVRTDGGNEFLVVRTRGGSDGDYWSAPQGWPAGVPTSSLHYFRPLVVLDNEFPRTIVKHLHLAFEANPALTTLAWLADQIEVQIRPPKPAEPLGLGAVIEDDKGNRWVRAFSLRLAWTDTLFAEDSREYADITAVRVLSEGVTP